MVVYADLEGTSHMVGRLWARIRKERESATFECEREIDRMASAFEHDDLRAALRLRKPLVNFAYNERGKRKKKSPAVSFALRRHECRRGRHECLRHKLVSG